VVLVCGCGSHVCAALTAGCSAIPIGPCITCCARLGLPKLWRRQCRIDQLCVTCGTGLTSRCLRCEKPIYTAICPHCGAHQAAMLRYQIAQTRRVIWEPIVRARIQEQQVQEQVAQLPCFAPRARDCFLTTGGKIQPKSHRQSGFGRLVDSADCIRFLYAGTARGGLVFTVVPKCCGEYYFTCLGDRPLEPAQATVTSMLSQLSTFPPQTVVISSCLRPFSSARYPRPSGCTFSAASPAGSSIKFMVHSLTAKS